MNGRETESYGDIAYYDVLHKDYLKQCKKHRIPVTVESWEAYYKVQTDVRDKTTDSKVAKKGR